MCRYPIVIAVDQKVGIQSVLLRYLLPFVRRAQQRLGENVVDLEIFVLKGVFTIEASLVVGTPQCHPSEKAESMLHHMDTVIITFTRMTTACCA
jgi:hypothetical protein